MPGWQPCREQRIHRLTTNQTHTLSAGPLQALKGEITAKPWPPSPGLPARAIISAKHGGGFCDVDTGIRLETTIILRGLTNSYQMVTAFGHYQAGWHSNLRETRISSASKSPHPVIIKQIRF